MAGLDGFGTALERSDMDPTAPTFTEIANVSMISGPGLSKETFDVTAHDSADKYREFLGSLKDAGEITLDINWDPGEQTHADLITDFEANDTRDYKLVIPVTTGSAEWAFSALLTGFDPSYPVDDKIEASVTFKVSGKPTLTVA